MPLPRCQARPLQGRETRRDGTNPSPRPTASPPPPTRAFLPAPSRPRPTVHTPRTIPSHRTIDLTLRCTVWYSRRIAMNLDRAGLRLDRAGRRGLVVFFTRRTRWRALGAAPCPHQTGCIRLRYRAHRHRCRPLLFAADAVLAFVGSAQAAAVTVSHTSRTGAFERLTFPCKWGRNPYTPGFQGGRHRSGGRAAAARAWRSGRSGRSPFPWSSGVRPGRASNWRHRS